MKIAALLIALQAFSGPSVRTITDPITDKTRVAAAWTADRDVLYIACDKAKSEVLVGFFGPSAHFGKTGIVTATWPLIYRFDKGEVVTETWWHDGDASHTVGAKQTADFIRLASAGKQLTIRAEPSPWSRDRDVVDLQFMLGDAKPAIAEVLRACPSSKVSGLLPELTQAASNP